MHKPLCIHQRPVPRLHKVIAVALILTIAIQYLNPTQDPSWPLRCFNQPNSRLCHLSSTFWADLAWEKARCVRPSPNNSRMSTIYPSVTICATSRFKTPPKAHHRSKSTTYADHPPPDFSATRNNKRASNATEDLLSPQVIKHATGGQIGRAHV